MTDDQRFQQKVLEQTGHIRRREGQADDKRSVTVTLPGSNKNVTPGFSAEETEWSCTGDDNKPSSSDKLIEATPETSLDETHEVHTESNVIECFSTNYISQQNGAATAGKGATGHNVGGGDRENSKAPSDTCVCRANETGGRQTSRNLSVKANLA